MNTSNRELSIGRVVDWDIFQNIQNTLFPCFYCIPKTGKGPTK